MRSTLLALPNGVCYGYPPWKCFPITALFDGASDIILLIISWWWWIRVGDGAVLALAEACLSVLASVQVWTQSILLHHIPAAVASAPAADNCIPWLSFDPRNTSVACLSFGDKTFASSNSLSRHHCRKVWGKFSVFLVHPPRSIHPVGWRQ